MNEFNRMMLVDGLQLDTALTSTAMAIRRKTGGTEDIPFDYERGGGFMEAVDSIRTGDSGDYDQGYEDGKNSVVPLERYVGAITFNNLNLFGKEEIVFNLDMATTLERFYLPNGENKTVKHITVNCPNQIASLRDTFNGSIIYDKTLEHITLNVDTSLCQWWYSTFNRMQALKTIDGTPLNPINVNNNGFYSTFNQVAALENVRFIANSILKNISFSSSPNLSAETTQSIFDGLAPVETAQTLTFHSNVKILQSQVDSANAKGWNVAGGVVVSEEEYYAE